MSLMCSELIDEVKAATGRDNDSALITDNRVLRWLNKAQEEIAEQCPGLVALDFKNTTSVDFTEVLSYSLAEFTSPLNDITGENRICHIYRAAYSDGEESQWMCFLPLDDFDRRFVDPTNENRMFSKPKYFTRRGGYIETFPVCSTAEVDKDFRLDGSVYPVDFTGADSTESSSLDRADDLLIAYAAFKSWSYIGKADNAQLWLAKFNGLLVDYRTRNDTMHEWEANIYGEYV